MSASATQGGHNKTMARRPAANEPRSGLQQTAANRTLNSLQLLLADGLSNDTELTPLQIV